VFLELPSDRLDVFSADFHAAWSIVIWVDEQDRVYADVLRVAVASIVSCVELLESVYREY
jgi:hypothetical protein